MTFLKIKSQLKNLHYLNTSIQNNCFTLLSDIIRNTPKENINELMEVVMINSYMLVSCLGFNINDYLLIKAELENCGWNIKNPKTNKCITKI